MSHLIRPVFAPSKWSGTHSFRQHMAYMPLCAAANQMLIMTQPCFGRHLVTEKVIRTFSEWGKYVDHANHEVSEIAQKFAWFHAGITLI